MANDFTKEEKVAFDEILEGFEKQLTTSNAAKMYRPDQTTMERTNDTIWRPMPYIATSVDGLDITGQFDGMTQLSVPASINTIKNVPWQMDGLELRDALQEGRLGDSAKQKLAADIEVSTLTAVTNLGSIVSARPLAAQGFEDVGDLDAMCNELGIQQFDRYVAYGSTDYNKLAKDVANRDNMAASKTVTAYERALVGRNIAGFDVFKLDTTRNLVAASATGVTMNGANQKYIPKATVPSPNGGTSNVDNRFQTISLTVTSGTLKVGDSFTIAGVNSVHPITKEDTGRLKTFRIVQIVTGSGGTGTVVITPAIVSAAGSPTRAEKQYQNVTATPANGAVITFLNKVTARANPFWKKEALEIIPGRIVVPSGSGLAQISATTTQGIQVLMTKQTSIDNYSTKFRVSVSYGVNVLNTEMAGIQIFNQT